MTAARPAALSGQAQPVRIGLALIILCLATLAAFWPVLHNGFVNWDDGTNIRDNLSYRGLGWAQLRWMWTTFHMGHYQPLSWMSLGLDFLLWGMDPVGYHLTNVLLHMTNAVLFYFVALRLLRGGMTGLSESEGPRLGSSALFAALIFSLHPLRVESVAWVTERRDVLSGSFYLATVLFYLKACAPARLAAHRRCLRAAFLCYFLSLLSKGIGVTLPLALLILDVYPLGRLPGDPTKWLAPQTRPILSEKIPFLTASALFGVIALLAQRHTGVIARFASVGILARVELAFFAAAFYLWKTIAPAHLLPLYARPAHLDVWAWPFLSSIGIVAATSAGLFSLRKRWPAPLAAWSYYLITLLPVLGIVLCGVYLAADRYTYLPCLGWALLAGAAVQRALQRSGAPGRAALMLALSGLLAGLGVSTWRQSGIWHDSQKLWGYTLSIDPRCAPAHNNLGTALAREGLAAQAIAQFQSALSIDPDYAEAHNNLGTARAREGRPAQAIAEYREALRIEPTYAMARDNLGAVLTNEGRFAEAMAEYEQALRINPDDAHARNNLGLALAAGGRAAEAIAEYRQALRLSPNYAQAHNNLGLALAGQGQVPQAVNEFQRALETDPNYAEAAENLRRVLSLRR